MKNEYKPTKEELVIINERFAKEPYKSVDDLYVFWAMPMDNQITLYFTKATPEAMNKWKDDLMNGVSFLTGHKNTMLPIARSFKSQIVEHEGLIDLYGKFFMQRGIEIEGIKTDDFMQAYLGGTLEDVSIGHLTRFYKCSICGLDIRDFNCPHLPGKEYDSENGKILCFAYICHTEQKPTELVEVSAVYKGAVPRAKLKGKEDVPVSFTSSIDELKKSDINKEVCMAFSIPIKKIDYSLLGEGGEKGMDIEEILKLEVSVEETKLLREKYSEEELTTLLAEFPASELVAELGDDKYVRWTRAFINDLPNGSFAVIEPAYTRGDTDNKNCRHLPHHGTGGGGTSNENLDLPHLRNAMARMNQIQSVTDSISTEELRRKAATHLEHHRSALGGGRREEDFVELEEKLKTSEANNKVLLEQNTNLTSEINQLKTEMETIKQSNVQLQKEVDELKPKAKDGEKYREDLINETLDLGIKLNGNDFDKANYEKLLKESARTIDDIKKMRDQFLKELCERFPGGRQTASPQLGLPEGDKGQSQIPDEAFKS